MPVRPPLKGPRKAGKLPLLRAHTREGWMISDYRIRELFENADVMSEGAWRASQSGVRSYFGTTSIVLPTCASGGAIPDVLLAPAFQIFKRDPHVRLRALRIACREASVRAEIRLGSIRADLTMSAEAYGLRIHIDVEAEAATSIAAPGTAATRVAR